MSNKAETPDNTQGVIKATRTGSRLCSPDGTLHEHPTNALSPQRAHGTAASQFWFELGLHVIEIVVRGNKTYTINHPASQSDLKALGYELNIFNEDNRPPSLHPPALLPPAAPQFQHMNFHFTLRLPYSAGTLCGFDLSRAQRIPQRFPNLKSIAINLDVRPEQERQGFIVPETMRKRSATMLRLLGIASDAADAVAKVDESCRQELELINGVLVEIVKHLREILGEKVVKRYIYLTRRDGGVYRPPKALGRVVMGEVAVDPQVIADVLMSEEGEKWLMPF
ncbi:hypothetical protein KC332_g2046 [Hortaea werneckii]|nr:hypothetical protein KC350_g5854 [Hortaea werneckii]KAI6848012.1 hypothetical protein KC358_g2026 [Hortaea werneckii]KAI6942682.1 hypothetical protein KC341_g2068 [Hortaea werneckii]KAI6948474.1 hypothetical protein KC348_g1903 [Hortaea werneckii]KAI6980522.1 hypothetical protein KC321_g1744 [Hortaea werneckii]